MNKPKIAALILRLTLGVCFVVHGWPKVASLFGERGPGTWPAQVEAMGLEPAAVMAAAIAFGEFLSGVAMLLGAFTSVAAVVITVIMAGAIWTVHGENGYSLANQGFEYNAALIAMAVSVLLLGPGIWAVQIRRKRE